MMDSRYKHLRVPPEELGSSVELLLKREADAEYLKEWTALVAKEKVPKEKSNEESVLLFRLCKEWLAISTTVCKQVSRVRPTHTVPNRSKGILKGLVNISGQIRICVALEHVLGIEDEGSSSESASLRRMLMVHSDKDTWVFTVAEIYGIYSFDVKMMTNLPVTVAKAPPTYLKGIFAFGDRNVGYIDDELLFYSLKRSIM